MSRPRKDHPSKKAEAEKKYYDEKFELYKEGYPLAERIIGELRLRKYIDTEVKFKKVKLRPRGNPVKTRKPKARYVVSANVYLDAEDNKVDEQTIIVKSSPETDPVIDEVLETKQLPARELRRMTKSGSVVWKGSVETRDWKIQKDEIFNHSIEFYNWICSINHDGFQNRIDYYRFENYKRQAAQWLSDKTNINDFDNFNERTDYVESEIERCKTNSLYFLEKYYPFKDTFAKEGGGMSVYQSGEAQKIIAFLIDSFYNLTIAKVRQMWASTTIFGICTKDTYMNPSFICNIVIADDDMAVSMFSEKIKDPYYGLSPLIKPSKPTSDTKNQLEWYKHKKLQSAGFSGMYIHTAKPTAVNSRSPNRFVVDEQCIVDCLTAMIEEWKPTLMQWDWKKARRLPTRQFIAFGSAYVEKNGQVIESNPQFEHEFKNALRAFESKDPIQWRRQMIPLFFNFYAKHGVDERLYNELREEAYADKTANAEEKRARFHKSNPLTIDDLWIGGSATIIPRKTIDDHIVRIHQAEDDNREQYGYWQPKLSGGKIIGSLWCPVEDQTDTRVSGSVLASGHPQKSKYRYVKGTDPVANFSGQSEFASTVWDKITLRPVSLLSIWHTDHKYAFEQSLLQGLYFDMKCPDLIENNAGQAYVDYLETQGFLSNVMTNLMLPDEFQSGNCWWGINKKSGGIGSVRWHIVNALVTMLVDHGKDIWFSKMYHQLKTFVKDTKQTSENAYKVGDPRVNRDDAIDAMVYGFIAMISDKLRLPVDLTKTDAQKKKRFVTGYDASFNLVRKEVFV